MSPSVLQHSHAFNLPSQVLDSHRHASPSPLLTFLYGKALDASQCHDEEAQFLAIDIKHLPPFDLGELDIALPRREIDGGGGESGRLMREIQELGTEEGGVQMGEGRSCDEGAGGGWESVEGLKVVDAQRVWQCDVQLEAEDPEDLRFDIFEGLLLYLVLSLGEMPGGGKLARRVGRGKLSRFQA